MNRSVALGAVLFLLSVGPVHATAVQDAAVQFGLIGTWADDCSRAASDSNEYAHYVLTPDGAVGLVYDNGPSLQNRYRWDTGRLVGDSQIALDGVFFGNGLGQHALLEKRGGKLRTWQSADSSGRRLVVDGAFPSGGAPSWLTKCSG